MQELKRLRNELGWSQQRLADESGVNKATINQVEQGKRSPSIATLESLARAMGAEVGDFFPKVQASLPFETGGRELNFWTLYLTHLTKHFEDLVNEEAEPCRWHGRGDVAPGVADDALTAVEALLDGVQNGTVVASAADVRSALRAAYRLAKAADRIDELSRPELPQTPFRITDEYRADLARVLVEARFRQIVDGLELSERDREEIFA